MAVSARLRRARPRMSAVSCAQQVEHAVRAVHHDVGQVGQRVLLVEPEQTSRPGSPSPRSSSTALNASTSPRSSPHEHERRWPRAPRRAARTRRALVHAVRAHLDHAAAGLDVRSWLLGRPRRAAAAAARTPPRGRRAGGCARRPRAPSPRPRRPAASASRSSRGQLAHEGGEPARRLRRDHPPVGRGPALVAVLAEHEQLPPALADRVADLLEAAEVERLAGGAPGDHGHRAHLRGERRPAPRRRRGGCGRSRGRPRSARGCRRSRGRRPGRRQRAPGRRTRCSPVVELNSMDATVPARTTPLSKPVAVVGGAPERSAASEVVVGEDHGQPVEPHRLLRRPTCLMPRSRPSAWAASLRRGG